MSAIRATGIETSTSLRALGEGTDRHGDAAAAVVTDRAQAVAEPAAGQPDLAQRRGQRDPGPHRLLAELGALQRLCDGDQGPAGRGAARQRSDLAGRHPGDPGGPRGVLRDPVAGAEQVRRQLFPAHAVPLEERDVVQVLDEQGVQQAEHQRGVRTRRHRQPAGPRLLGQVALAAARC